MSPQEELIRFFRATTSHLHYGDGTSVRHYESHLKDRSEGVSYIVHLGDADRGPTRRTNHVGAGGDEDAVGGKK